ncbi:MAG: ATP-binding domain-containing protein [Campylobacteraceae bacterium]|nr:ATP-binding domain-containing protein [Campylobacteraceae bacterium]
MEKTIATELSPEGIDDNIFNYLEEEEINLELDDAILYFGFPVFKDYEQNSVKPKFVLLSPNHGIVLIYTSDKHTIKEDDEILEQLYSFVESSFRKSKILRKNKRELAIPINSYLYASNIDENKDEYDLENDILTSLSAIFQTIVEIHTDEILSEEIIKEARSIIEGAKVVASTSKRIKVSEDPHNKSNILIALEKEITNFDEEQRKIAINLINGPQRIRGLAGSGKTIVLAMKVANIHLQHPKKRILFTFYTKSLYGLIKELITKFYWHYAGTEPNWDLIDILHSWGGRRIDGVAFNVSIDNNFHILSFKEAQTINPMDPFKTVCQRLLKNRIEAKYDYILIDEAQDLPNEFFQICFKLAYGESGEQKNIVWAYDELQSIFQVYQRTPQELFGQNSSGIANIDLNKFRLKLHHTQKNDLVLFKCYRNPLEVLITAHALGFGLYSDNHVQRLENAEHWRDVGYTVQEDQNFNIGSTVKIKREHKNSPLSIYQYQSPSDLIETFAAENAIEECEWICNKIKGSIEEGLNPHDILVIGLDDKYANKYFAKISSLLLEYGIRSNNLLASRVAAPPFCLKDMVTLSTVHRAKGNEAALVFAAGIDALYHQRNTIKGRNKLFTAFTRTKAWLKISGIKKNSIPFFKEIEMSLTNSPELKFTVQEISSIQRDFDSSPDEIAKLYSVVDEFKEKGYTQEQLKILFNETIDGQ